jgi:multiple antibiotic resistance protein
MGNMISAYLHDFLILFGIVNVVGNIPNISSLTTGQNSAEKRKTFVLASFAAFVIVLVFALFGNFLLASLFNVSFAAFKVAGGIIVFLVAARGSVLGPSHAVPKMSDGQKELPFLGIAFPFLVGPGTMVTTILLMQASGRFQTSIVTLLVFACVLIILFAIPLIEKITGKILMLMVSRILYIFIAAKATTFVISGLRECFK